MSYREHTNPPFFTSKSTDSGLDLSVLNFEDLKRLWLETLNKGMHGICFSLYEEGQIPGDKISIDQVERRIKIYAYPYGSPR